LQSSGAAPAEPAAFARAKAGLATINAPLLPPPGTIYLGAFVAPNPHAPPAEQIADTANFESSIGRTLAINLHYHLWSDTLAGIGEKDDINNHRIPIISWSCVNPGGPPVSDAAIAAGTWDKAITTRAKAVAKLAGPVFLRYKWEMNLLYNKQCAGPNDIQVNGKSYYSPADFVAAWQHIRSIFVGNNATNVVWLWNPSGSGIDPDQSGYYPGDDNVDWVGFDWYDTFDQYFLTIYSDTTDPKGNSVYTYPHFLGAHPNKPLMIGETGAFPNFQTDYFNGDQESNPSAVTALQSDLQNIQAYVYWDSKSTLDNYQIPDPGAGSPFYSFANSPYMSGMSQMRIER